MRRMKKISPPKGETQTGTQPHTEVAAEKLDLEWDVLPAPEDCRTKGKTNPVPIRMSALSCLSLQLELIDVEFPTPKRRDIGERLCLGLNCNATPYMAHKTDGYGQMLTLIREELSTIDGVKESTFTAIHVGHNTNDVSPSCLHAWVNYRMHGY
jgi:hypothetical protein